MTFRTIDEKEMVLVCFKIRQFLTVLVNKKRKKKKKSAFILFLLLYYSFLFFLFFLILTDKHATDISELSTFTNQVRVCGKKWY